MKIKSVTCQLSSCAGVHVCGADVFIGRVQVEPAPMHNIDFLIQDLDSGAQWLRAAATENYDYQMGMRQVSLFATDETCYILDFLLSWCIDQTLKAKYVHGRLARPWQR